MKYLVENLGRKGTLGLFVFLTDAGIELFKGLSPAMVELSLIALGIFSGANVFEHFFKRK